MRSSKEAGCFPYGSSTVCYMELTKDGNIKQLMTRESKGEALRNANAGDSKILAVWPGRWRSDLFIIDDLDEFYCQQML